MVTTDRRFIYVHLRLEYVMSFNEEQMGSDPELPLAAAPPMRWAAL